MPVRAIQTLALLLIGGLYWQTVVWVTGAKEPWDAPTYRDAWYPGSLLLSACAGPFLKRSSWQAGLLLTLSQLPIMALNSEPGALVLVGLMFLAALAVPAMMLSQLTGWIAQRVWVR